MTKRINTAVTDSDFVKIADRSPNLTGRRVSGSHVTYTTSGGRATITNHGRELAPWLRRKIMLEFIAIGIVCLLALWGVWSLVA